MNQFGNPVSAIKHLNSLRRKVFILPAGFSGCAWWRYRLPLNKLIKLGSKFDIFIKQSSEQGLTRQEIIQQSKECDLFGVQAPGDPDAAALLKFYHSEKKKIVIDYDDFSFDLSPFNPRYGALGIKECTVFDEAGKEKMKWRDMENEFDLKHNQERYEAFTACVKEADLVTTTTEYLANKFREKTPNVALCPNSIDFDLWKPLPRPEKYNNQIRIGWFGGDSHYGDIKILKDVFKNLVAKYPNVVITLQAPPVPFWNDVFEGIPPNRLDWKYWVDLEYYTLLLANRHFDIGLCPLEDNDFNRCKSGIKHFEFGALKVPTVCTNIVPYNLVVKDKETGFLVENTTEAWMDTLSKLIENKELRLSMGEANYQDIYKNHNINQHCMAWEKAFSEVLEGKYSHVDKN